MSNSCVITTEKKDLGVYLHWNGGRDSVEAFLAYCKKMGYRSPETDCYGYARLCQVIGNFFGGTCSVGIDVFKNFDKDFLDNGVYIIRSWEIVKREVEGDYNEQEEYDLDAFLKYIDNSMPESEKIFNEELVEEVKTEIPEKKKVKKMFVTNGKETKKIPQDEFLDYVAKGYRAGRK